MTLERGARAGSCYGRKEVMRILITSPAPETAELVSSLTARGHQVTVIPLMMPERIEAPKVKLEGAQGFLVTSTEAVRALANAVAVRFFPLFADSLDLAKAAKAEGFTNVKASAGDASDFAKLIEATLKPDEGALIHACHDKETTAH